MLLEKWNVCFACIFDEYNSCMRSMKNSSINLVDPDARTWGVIAPEIRKWAWQWWRSAAIECVRTMTCTCVSSAHRSGSGGGQAHTPGQCRGRTSRRASWSCRAASATDCCRTSWLWFACPPRTCCSRCAHKSDEPISDIDNSTDASWRKWLRVGKT